jgi:alpha-tubulin suppressor-like RCC1 family protein
MGIIRAINRRVLTPARQRGYLLPATILLGLSISIVSGAYLQFTASTNQSLVTQSYKSIAQDAARAGIEYSSSCLATNVSDWSALTPGSDCTGTSNGGSNYLNQEGTEWRSTFSVLEPNGVGDIVSTGIVEVLNNGNVVQRVTATTKMNAAKFLQTFPISTGESITDIRNDNTDCAIANGKVYCWGDNSSGQVGDGTYTGRAVPTLIQGAIAGKTVTRVSVSITTTCVIADGLPYCWGGGGAGQLGMGWNGNIPVPSANVPATSSGPLSGQFVTDIGTASWNDPASIIWPFATAFQHSCALTADGSVSCWGDGSFRQNTGGGCVTVFWICIGFYSYPSYNFPALTVGYSYGGEVLSGQKSERVGASSHDSCSLSEGHLICWGVQAPIAIWCNSVLFSAAWETIVPYNPCVASYTNGYDTHSIWFSALGGKYVDPNLWDISSNEGCFMANFDYICFGTTPGFDLFWLDSWGAPWLMEANADVTDADNGDSVGSLGLTGLFCDIDGGTARCAASPFDGYGGTGVSGYKWLAPLIQTSGLSGKVPTKIAAGQDHGCLTANGQLLCWGNGNYGVLADGSYGNAFDVAWYPTVTGRTGSTPIGTVNGTYAASGQVSAGGDHTCGVANGKLFCWGKNNFGQLGMGNTNDLAQPQSVPALSSFKSITKVSAGEGHTCAIALGKLYCWGHNDHGQLGIGNNSDQNTPQLVNGLLAGKRVTEVSAGFNGTCAIANGQPYCWGYNANQQLGDGTTTERTTPVLVNGGGGVLTNKAVTQITIGTSHACAISNADVYCWGNNANGRTGLNTTVGNAAPTRLTLGTAGSPTGPNGVLPMVTGISAGDDFTCGIFNATVSCWGNNANGRTGQNTNVGNTVVPASLKGPGGTALNYYATNVSAGDAHACGVINGNNSALNGNLWCWGMGANGRIGDNSTSDRLIATLINGGATIDTGGVRRVAISVDAGGSSSCGVANAVILCWGMGANGRLGDNVLVDSIVPVTTSSYRVLSPYEKGPIF